MTGKCVPHTYTKPILNVVSLLSYPPDLLSTYSTVLMSVSSPKLISSWGVEGKTPIPVVSSNGIRTDKTEIWQKSYTQLLMASSSVKMSRQLLISEYTFP